MSGRNISISIDYQDLKRQVNDKVEKFKRLADNPSLKKELALEFASGCDPYVPYRTGALADGYTVTKTGAIKYAPVAKNGFHYAGFVYDGLNTRPNPGAKFLFYTKTQHPLAGPRWNKRFIDGPGYQVFLEKAAIMMRDTIQRS